MKVSLVLLQGEHGVCAEKRTSGVAQGENDTFDSRNEMNATKVSLLHISTTRYRVMTIKSGSIDTVHRFL
jgi:hypothetical protein